MTILPDYQILEAAEQGMIIPFDEKSLNPASYDLRLGNLIRRPHSVWSMLNRQQVESLILSGDIRSLPYWSEPIKFDAYWLMPNEFVLCHSLEFVNIPDDTAALLFSKSSTGRVGLEHLHAGFGDPGFGKSKDNNTPGASWTWELHNVAPWPIELIAGKRIMQQVFFKMTDKPIHSYQETGRYNGQVGPTPARSEKV